MVSYVNFKDLEMNLSWSILWWWYKYY